MKQQQSVEEKVNDKKEHNFAKIKNQAKTQKKAHDDYEPRVRSGSRFDSH